jgi:hypothetical protein
MKTWLMALSLVFATSAAIANEAASTEAAETASTAEGDSAPVEEMPEEGQ